MKKTIFSFLSDSQKMKSPIIGWKRNGRLKVANKEEYLKSIGQHIALLKSCGITKGMKVGLMAKGGVEWHLLDMAAMALGAIVVPLYPNQSSDNLITTQRICSIDFFFIEHTNQLTLFTNQIFDDKVFLSRVEKGSSADIKCNLFFYRDLLKNSSEHEINPLDYFDTIQEDDIAAYLLTSGTSGDPKAVIVDHQAQYHLLESIREFMGNKLSPGSRSLTHLPLAHVLGRCDSLLHLALPVQTTFGESLDDFFSDLKIIEPSFIITVPRVISKLRQKILQGVESRGDVQNIIFQNAFKIVSKYLRSIEAGNTPTRLEQKLFYTLRNSVLNPIVHKLSPHLRFLVCGGASLREEVYDFFKVLGVPVLQGYGLTETLGPITFTPLEDPRQSDVGIPLKGCEIKIAPDGEILLKGSTLLKSYKNIDGEFDPRNEEGYFETGDIGRLTNDGFLRITDRKKDIFVTSSGKNIYPQKIENLLSTSPYIEYFLAIGDGEKFISGLVGLQKNAFMHKTSPIKITSDTTHGQLAAMPQVRELISKEIERLNEKLLPFERVKKFHIVESNLNNDSNTLTPSLKLRRNRVYSKYKSQIDALYN